MTTENGLTEDAVLEWLQGQPEFFIRHPELLAANLEPEDTVIPMEVGELQWLRRQNKELRVNLAGMLERIRQNEEIYRIFHAIAITMIHAESLTELINGLAVRMEKAFAIDRVSVALGDDPATPGGKILAMLPGAGLPGEMAEGLGQRLFFPGQGVLQEALGSSGQCIIRIGREGANRQLFFGSASDDIRSEALVPLLHDGSLIGSLNLGARVPSRFLPSHATDLVSNLAEVLTICLCKPTVNLDVARPPPDRELS